MNMAIPIPSGMRTVYWAPDLALVLPEFFGIVQQIAVDDRQGGTAVRTQDAIYFCDQIGTITGCITGKGRGGEFQLLADGSFIAKDPNTENTPQAFSEACEQLSSYQQAITAFGSNMSSQKSEPELGATTYLPEWRKLDVVQDPLYQPEWRKLDVVRDPFPCVQLDEKDLEVWFHRDDGTCAVKLRHSFLQIRHNGEVAANNRHGKFELTHPSGFFEANGIGIEHLSDHRVANSDAVSSRLEDYLSLSRSIE